MSTRHGACNVCRSKCEGSEGAELQRRGCLKVSPVIRHAWTPRGTGPSGLPTSMPLRLRMPLVWRAAVRLLLLLLLIRLQELQLLVNAGCLRILLVLARISICCVVLLLLPSRWGGPVRVGRAWCVRLLLPTGGGLLMWLPPIHCGCIHSCCCR
jgi:hypothetical protein